MADFVLTEVDGPIGWITLNDPDRLNPVTFERIGAINQAAAAMSDRGDVHVVVITGAGRAFCAEMHRLRVDPLLTHQGCGPSRQCASRSSP